MTIFFVLQAQQRELMGRHVKEIEKEMSRNLHLQKEQYEATIQRHLTFIDQVGDAYTLSVCHAVFPRCSKI